MKQRKFRVPNEGQIQETTARRYVQMAWPEAALTQVDALFERGKVEADGILITRPDRPLAPDTTIVFATEEEGERTYGVPEVDALLRGEEWVVVDKPAGIPGKMTEDDPTDPIRFMADVLGLDRSRIRPVWTTPASTAGPWLLALDEEVAQRLRSEIAKGEVQTSWQAIIPRPARGQGRWTTKGGHVDFAVTRTRGELAEVQLQPQWEGLDDATELYVRLLALLAEVGSPVVGDVLHGGYLVPGDLRLRLGAMYGTEEFSHSWSAPRDWWPEQPVIAPVVPKEGLAEGPKQEIARLEVPQRVLDALEERDHPWVMRDPAIRGEEELKPGRMVQLVGPEGPVEYYALIDGMGPIATRLWSTSQQEAEDFDGEVAIRLDEAIGKRRELFQAMATTDVFRLVHGEADGLPGLVIDRLGPVLRVALVGRCARAYGESVYEQLGELEPEATIVEVVADRESVGRSGGEPKVRIIQRGRGVSALDQSLIVREEGLRYRVDPRRPFDVELSVDHRDNRKLAAERSGPGQHWLVISGDGGSFGLAVARAGTTVTHLHSRKEDAKKMDAHFELNGLSTDLRKNIVGDVAQVLEDGKRRYQGIVVDVPAMGSVTQVGSVESVVERCLEILEHGGWLLFCRRGMGGGKSLTERVKRVVESGGYSVERLESADPGEDFPHMEGFAEGRPFEGVWLKLEE